MHKSIDVNDFNYNDFMKSHYNDFVIFVSGKWDYITQKGEYTYATFYKGKNICRRKSFDNVKSSNVVMLYGVIDACDKIKLEKENVYIISPTELGFVKAQKKKGINYTYIEKIFDICDEKNLQLNSIGISGGGYIVKGVINSCNKEENGKESIKYNKLVRDKIPQIIENDGKICVYEILSDDEYIKFLDKKLNEELTEYQESKSLEELADLLEVIYSVAKARGWSIDELENVRLEKVKNRGSFEEKILLKEVKK